MREERFLNELIGLDENPDWSITAHECNTVWIQEDFYDW